MEPTLENLGFGGDGDELLLIEAIEDSFGIEFQGNELAAVVTVGDLYDAILKKLPATGLERRDTCRSATAFRRIRHELRMMAFGKVTPASRLVDIASGTSQRRLIRDLEEKSGLSLDALTSSAPLFAASFVVSLIVSVWYFVIPTEFPSLHFLVGLLLAAVTSAVGAALLLIPAALIVGDRGATIDESIVTVGDLAHRTAHLNFARLTGAGKHNHPDDVWQAVVWLSTEMADHRGTIDRQTRIIAD